MRFKNQKENDQTVGLKLVQWCCATCLDQFFTQPWTSFKHNFLCIFFGGGGPKPLFYSVFSKQNAIFKETPQEQNTTCKHNCITALFESVLSLRIFIFLNFPFLESCFLIGCKHKSKKNKKEPENKMQIIKTSRTTHTNNIGKSWNKKQRKQTEKARTKNRNQKETSNQHESIITLELQGKQCFQNKKKETKIKQKEIKAKNETNNKKSTPKITPKTLQQTQRTNKSNPPKHQKSKHKHKAKKAFQQKQTRTTMNKKLKKNKQNKQKRQKRSDQHQKHSNKHKQTQIKTNRK